MAFNCGGIVNICRVRVTALDANGNVAGTTDNNYVTDKVTEVGVSPNIETGDTITQKNGCGCPVVRFKVQDIFNYFDLTFTEAAFEPALLALLLSGENASDQTITNGADTVGLAFAAALDCSEAAPTVALEFWTQMYVGSSADATYPWMHWVFPRTSWQFGDNTFAEGVALPTLSGFSKSNPNWGDGPYGDGPPDGQDISEGGVWATATVPPVAACDTGNVTPSS